MLLRPFDRALLVVMAAACAAIFYLAVMLATAHARNADGRYDNSPNKEWFESQFNSNGGWCCNESDGHEYDGNYTLNSDGSVTAEFEGQQYNISKELVLTGPNPTGHAVWWYLPGPNGNPHTYCFSPGQLG